MNIIILCIDYYRLETSALPIMQELCVMKTAEINFTLVQIWKLCLNCTLSYACYSVRSDNADLPIN